jgi:hypothetical protein
MHHGQYAQIITYAQNIHYINEIHHGQYAQQYNT